MPTPAAYLRKSRSDDPTREVSRDVQESAVRDLAARDGYDPATLVIYEDWDKSADESKASRRVAFRRLLRAIEAGEHSALYAYVPDRLYRGLESYVNLTTAAAKAGVRIVTTKGAIGGSDDPMVEFQSDLGAILGKLELGTASVRAKAAYAARVRRGDYTGQAPYGSRLSKDDAGRVVLVPDPDRPLAPVLDAYRRAGGRTRTAVRILNDELRIPSPYGRAWDRVSLLRIIDREAPDLRPPKGATGRREHPAKPALFAKLLRCHCGRLLTPNVRTERRRSRETVQVNYYCAAGNASPATHGRPYYVSEGMVRPWIEAEARRLRIPSDAVRVAGEDAAQRERIETRRARFAELYGEGAIGRDRWLAERERAERDLAALGAAKVVHELPALDWSRPVDWVSAYLRALFEYVQLGTDLRPVRAEWRVREWRSPVVAV